MSWVRISAVALVVTTAAGGLALAKDRKRDKRHQTHQAHQTKKKGRVVRVERSQGSRNLLPRVCGQVDPSGGVACWGKPVEIGEIGTVYDETGRKADIRVDTVTPQYDGCQNTTGWQLTTTLLHGTLDQASYMSYAVFDWRGTEQTRTLYNNGQIVSPGNKMGETVLSALDDDLDDVADLIVTYYQCDPSGTPSQYGAGGGAYCVTYYQRDAGASYSELRTDVVRSCY
jgi:hypothetical protein